MSKSPTKKDHKNPDKVKYYELRLQYEQELADEISKGDNKNKQKIVALQKMVEWAKRQE